MDNLTMFNTLDEYNEFKQKEMPYTNVSYVGENDTVYYFKEDIETTPFTVEIIDLDSNYNECCLYVRLLNQDSCDGKFRIYDNENDTWGDWQDINGTTVSEDKIMNLHEHDKVQFICKFNNNDNIIGDLAVWPNVANDSTLIGHVKLSGNFMSYVIGEDYLIDTEAGGSIGWYPWGEQWQKQTIKDITDLWFPIRSLKSSSYRELFSGCSLIQSLPLTNGVPIVKAYFAPHAAYYNMYQGCDISVATIDVRGTYENNDAACDGLFSNNLNLTTLYISKDTNIQNIWTGVTGGCSSLSTIYNYSPNYLNVSKDSISQTGTLYYVDYGNNMNYDPNEMVPSGWTKTAISLPE